MNIQRVIHSFAVFVEIDMTRVAFEGHLSKSNQNETSDDRRSLALPLPIS